MAKSNATSVEEYLQELPEDRAESLQVVRQVILANLPKGIVETMNWGMISYEVPLDTCAETYNGKPLLFAALASQKHHMAIYLNSIYGNEEAVGWFEECYAETGLKADMGKSCLRFRSLDQLPLELIGEAVARESMEQFLESYRPAKK